MNQDEPDPRPAFTEPEPVTSVMRRVLDSLEMIYDHDVEDDVITLRIQLENVEVGVFLYGQNADLACAIVRLPVRAPQAVRPLVGEFLHRLNYAGKRKFWEMDYNDGEIRLRATTDTIDAPLSETMFRAMGRAVLEIADRTFPYLNAVICRSMKPDFAADQAIAALDAGPGDDEGEEDDGDDSEDGER
jgi:hypothetical protein